MSYRPGMDLDPAADAPDVGVGGASAPDWSLDDREPAGSDLWDADLAAWWEAEPGPDELGLVTEVADMMAMFAATRFRRVSALLFAARADTARYGGAVAGIVERSVRLELAAGLRITETA